MKKIITWLILVISLTGCSGQSGSWIQEQMLIEYTKCGWGTWSIFLDVSSNLRIETYNQAVPLLRVRQWGRYKELLNVCDFKIIN